MPVIGYQPAPNGVGYHFSLDDGSTKYLYGQQADDLARYIDQTRGPDMRTAQVVPTEADLVSRATRAAPPPIETASDIPMGAIAATRPERRVAFDRSLNPTPASAGPAAAPQSPQPAPGGFTQPTDVANLPVLGGSAAEVPSREEQLKNAYRDAIMTTAARGKFVPGTAAVNPQEMARTGVPVEASETVSGAINETEEQRAARLKRQEESIAANAEDAAAARAASAEFVAAKEEQRTSAFNQALKADIDRRDAEKQLVVAKQTAEGKWADIQKENQAAAEQRIDPNRLFHGQNGAAVAIGSAIAAGLGAFGASLGRSPNYAQQIIQGAIDRDIAAQTDAIHRRGEAARNAVADYARTYGLSLEEAKLAVKSTQYGYAASMADLNAAKLGTIDAKQKAAELSMQLRAKEEALRAQGQEMYEGRVQKHFAIVRPQAGTAGYYRKPTIEELGKGATALATTEKAFPGGPGTGKLSARLGATEAVNEAALQDLQNYKKNAPEGYVAPDLPALPRTDARVALDAAANAIVGKIVAGSNGSISQEELQLFRKDLSDPRESVRSAAAARLHEALRTTRDAIERQRGNTAPQIEIGGAEGGGE